MELPDINQYINQKEILRQTLEGINKNFLQIGEEAVFPAGSAPTFDKIVESLTPFIENLYHGKNQMFKALINRADISQEVLIKATEGMTGVALMRTIAALIVKRELQKVVIRNYFKKHG